MKYLFHLLIASVMLIGIGCGASTSDSPPTATVTGNWDVVNNDSSAGFGLTLNPNGSYTFLFLYLLNPNEANVMAENGTFTRTDDTMVFTPSESSCAARQDAFDPTTAKYSLKQDTLDLLLPDTAFSLTRNDTPPASNFLLHFGCFDSNHQFVVSPLAPKS